MSGDRGAIEVVTTRKPVPIPMLVVTFVALVYQTLGCVMWILVTGALFNVTAPLAEGGEDRGSGAFTIAVLVLRVVSLLACMNAVIQSHDREELWGRVRVVSLIAVAMTNVALLASNTMVIGRAFGIAMTVSSRVVGTIGCLWLLMSRPRPVGAGTSSLS